MKCIDISFPEKFKVGGNLSVFEKGGYAEFFEALLANGVQSKFPQGNVPLSKGRILARIQDKLDNLKPKEGAEPGVNLNVEEAEYDLIKSVFLDEATSFHVSQLQLATIYADAVEAAKEGTCGTNTCCKEE